MQTAQLTFALPTMTEKRGFRLCFILGFAAWLALVFELFYVIAINAFLSFGGLQLFFKSTNTVNATYERAFSVWPGVAHVRNLRIVFQDHNLQWSLDIEHAKAHIALYELVSRRFHVTRLEGGGASFRMRHRILPESAHEPWVPALPPIPEYQAPAVFEPTVPEPPISDDRYNLWTIHLEHVDVGVAEVWVQFVKYTGAGRVRGALQLVPARNLWVGPALLDLKKGRLTFGDEPIASQLVGTISCNVDLFDVRVPQGRQVFRYINSNIDLNAQQFQFRQFVPFVDPYVTIDAAPGILTTHLRVRRGQVAADSRLDYESNQATFSNNALRANGGVVHIRSRMDRASRIDTLLQVDRAQVGPAGEMHLRQVAARLVAHGDDLAGDFTLDSKTLQVSSFSLPRAKDIHVVFAQRLPISVTTGSLDGSFWAIDARGEMSGQLNVGFGGIQAETPKLAAEFDGQLQLTFNRNVNDSLKIDTTSNLRRLGLLLKRSRTSVVLHLVDASGSFEMDHQRVSAQFELNASSMQTRKLGSQPSKLVTGKRLTAHGNVNGTFRNLQARFTVGLKSLEMHSTEMVLRVQPNLRIAIRNFDPEHMTGALDASLQFAGWNAVYGADGGQCSLLELPLADLVASSRIDRRRVRASIRGNVIDQNFAWGPNFNARADLRFVATAVAERQTQDPTTINLTALVSNLHLRSGKGTTQGWELDAPELRIGSKILPGEHSTLAIMLNVSQAKGRIGTATLATDIEAEIPRLDIDLAHNVLQLNGRVRLNDAELDVGNRKVNGWWSEIGVRSARLLVQRNLDVSGIFEATMRDASPALAVLQSEGKVPGWLATLVPFRRIRTEGTVERHCRLTDIKFGRAVAGPLTAHGRLLSASDYVRGSFLVRLAAFEALSAGVEVGPSNPGLFPLVGEGWLHEHTQHLESDARQSLTAPCPVEPQDCTYSTGRQAP